jgi:hypothetical protein
MGVIPLLFDDWAGCAMALSRRLCRYRFSLKCCKVPALQVAAPILQGAMGDMVRNRVKQLAA